MANRKTTFGERHFTVRVSDEDYDRLRLLAEREHRTVSAEVRKVVLEHIAASDELEQAA
jgi:predicted DNA-binding protein